MLEARHIVIGFDFCPGGMAALREGARLVRTGVKDASVLNVVDSHNFAMHEGYSPKLIDRKAESCAKAGAKWKDVCEQVGPLPDLKFLMPVGSAASTLLEFAAPLPNALLILGINDSEPFRPGAGIVAAQCARYANSPVLLVSSKFTPPYRRIVLATDFSATAALACRWADEAARHDGAQLTVLHIRTPRESHDMAVVEERLRTFVKDHAPHVGATATCVVKDGPQRGRAIAEFAAEMNSDLIVMGRRGHSPIRHLFVGSTAERVLRQVECNILLLSPASG